MIKAVVFDLDDTLYPEIDYVKSGFRVVALEIEKIYGFKNAYAELIQLFEQDKNNVFNRFLENYDLPEDDNSVDSLLNVYRCHKPVIELRDDVKNVLIELRVRGYKLGIITDGRVEGQRTKLAALGVEKLVDKIIVTDELGGIEYRKPSPKAFEIICKEFGILPEEMMYVGDNPQKDFAIKKYLPITTIYLKQSGLYKQSELLYGIKPDYEVETISTVTELVND